MEPSLVISGWGSVSVSSAAFKSSSEENSQSNQREYSHQPESLLNIQSKVFHLLTELQKHSGFPDFILGSAAMAEVLLAMDRTRASKAPVLITGETGTGKELIARAVHLLSARSSRELIPLNCAAVNRELIESQLFGHRRGSFTSASTDSQRVIRAAEGGTLLLDEIGELPLDVQPKLLRFLQEGEIHPVGEVRPLKADVRIIASTNRNLEDEVRAGRFRADLFERLNLFRLFLPPLRQRREEIPLLVAHYLNFYGKEVNAQGLQASDEVMKLLCAYDWPRNIRQLANEIFRVVCHFDGDPFIPLDRLSPEIRAQACNRSGDQIVASGEGIVIPFHLSYGEAKDEVERRFILNAFATCRGNQSQAATKLQMNRDGLRKAIKRLKIEIPKS